MPNLYVPGLYAPATRRYELEQQLCACLVLRQTAWATLLLGLSTGARSKSYQANRMSRSSEHCCSDPFALGPGAAVVLAGNLVIAH